ncbi:MAG: YihY/virulence factor BrkB family protein [Leptospira sp.]|nr:YihY/virulence factor BrkB family protein [Leptospira sp.]
MNHKVKLIDNLFLLPEKKGFKRLGVLTIRVFSASIYRFLKDDCFTKCSGIAYIALLTITSGFNQKKEMLFDEINSFLLKNNILIDINPYLETLNNLVSAATQIGAIGFVILIFSATAILRTFETSFNQIWKVKSDRSFFSKIIFYFFILSIGPLMFATIEGFSEKLLDSVRSPHLISIARSSDNFLWISGEKGNIFKIDENGKRIAKLKDLKIDYENVHCKNSFGDDLEICSVPGLNKENFIKIRNKNNQLYALSENGVLLNSSDLGKSWKITFFANTRFKDFAIMNDETLFLIFSNGELLKYNKNGFSFKPIFKDTLKIQATRIKFFDSRTGFLLDANGAVWKTEDEGNNFVPQKVSDYALNDIDFINRDNFITVGDRGHIFKTTDSGKTWQNISHKKYSFNRIWIFSKNGSPVILVVNDVGNILFSLDQGNTWQLSYTPGNGKLLTLIPVNPESVFAFHIDPENSVPFEEGKNLKGSGDLLGIGEFNIISTGELKEDKLSWTNLQGGYSVFSIYSLLKIFIPLSGIWLFFVSLYTLIPNTRVPYRAAAYGAAITSIIFLIFLWTFGIYVSSFSESTVIIYRALAAIPIFLLSVYSLALIVLFGAEITATLHHKERYLSPYTFFEEKSDEFNYEFYNAIRYLTLLYGWQKNEKKAIQIEKLKRETELGNDEFYILHEKMSSAKFVSENPDAEISPVIRADDLTLLQVYEEITRKALSYPPHREGEKISDKLRVVLSEIDNATRSSLSKIRFSDLI